MEQIKIYDEYIDRLEKSDSIEKCEQSFLIEEITRVVLSSDEINELMLNYYYSYSEKNYEKDIAKLKAKLKFKRAILIDNEFKEKRIFEGKKMELEMAQIQAGMKDSKLVINNNNHNESIASSAVSISFEEVRKNIDNISSLTKEEIKAIKKKIDEIERITNSKESKEEKWSKAKDIIKWIADKGVDVGISLLPLILKIS